MFIVFTVPRSVASHVLIVLSGIAVLMTGLAVGLAYVQARSQAEATAAAEVVGIATSIAATDDVREGLAAADPAGALQQFAERQRVQTGTDFVVIMSPQGIRYTHPNPDMVGQRFIGNIAAAQAGGVVVERYTGTLGPSTRAVVPVMVDGQVRGLVSVGLARQQVSDRLRPLLPGVVAIGLLVGVLLGIAALLVARRVRHDTLGLDGVGLRELHNSSHEAANRLHTMVTLIELGRTDDAVEFATGRASEPAEREPSARRSYPSVGTTKDVCLVPGSEDLSIAEPVVAALLTAKARRAAGRGIDLVVDPEAMLPAGLFPPADLVIILGNLIDNAIEALEDCADCQRSIMVDAQLTLTEQYLTVADTGPGLSPQALRHGFERGWTTKAATIPAGRGLGLALVAEAVHRMGGRIDYSGLPDACFEVRLPLPAPEV